MAGPAPPDGLQIRWIELGGRAADRLLGAGRELRVNAPGELRRAARIVDRRHRDAFLASRVALRLILKEVAGVATSGVEFATTANGKPYLQGSSVHFSLSRSDGLAVVALSTRPVGIDVERERVLSPDVRNTLRRRLGGQGADPDIRAWTELEAAIKLGDGRLAESLGAWSMSLPGATAFPVDVPNGYVCTVCVFGAAGPVEQGEWRPSSAPPEGGWKSRPDSEWSSRAAGPSGTWQRRTAAPSA